jgi:hypothetical protein
MHKDRQLPGRYELNHERTVSERQKSELIQFIWMEWMECSTLIERTRTTELPLSTAKIRLKTTLRIAVSVEWFSQ